MRSLHRRLAALEEASRVAEPDETVWSLALDTDEGDFVFIGGEWRPCPNSAELLERDIPIKVYSGMSLRALIGPTADSAPTTPEPVA